MMLSAQIAIQSATKRAAYWLPVWSLCVTQVVSWGTLYYAFSLLLAPMGTSRGWNQAQMVGAFSVSLLVSGICAYPAGKLIHRYGGRLVMSAGSILAAVALLVVAVAPSLAGFYLGWALAGTAMALTLYEAAFAMLASAYDSDYRRAVTTVTLAGGFASTAFWPLTERMVVWIGWQQTTLVYAGLHLLMCLPMHAGGLRGASAQSTTSTGKPGRPAGLRSLLRQPRFILLASSYACNAIVFAAVSVHLIPLLQVKGASAQQAAWLAAAAGPMQVLGRVGEFLFGGRWRAAQTGTAAMLVLLPALLGLLIPGAPFSVLLICIGLYGLSNGVMTIVRSLSIVELFGRQNYAPVSGALAAPATLARALGPFLASLLLLHSPRYDGVLLALAVVATSALLLFVRANQRKLSYEALPD